MVIVQMHGEPGSGKSTVARALAPRIGALVLDKDVVKSALLRAGAPEKLAAGGAYEAYFDLAEDIAGQGYSLILDNPVYWPLVEEKWVALCQRRGVPLRMIECVCGDRDELTRRLATRAARESQPRAPYRFDLASGIIEPSCERLVVDTTRPLDEIAEEALAYLRAGASA